MPNAAKKNTGSSLRHRMREAARLTAEQQRATYSGEGGERPTGSRSASIHSGKVQPRSARTQGSVGKRGRSEDTGKRDTAKFSKRRVSKEKKRALSRRDGEAKKSAGRSRGVSLSTRSKVVLGIVAVLVLAAVVIYPVAQPRYQSLRTEQQLQAVADAVNERNAKIEGQNKALQTPEGIEAKAREEYGWVKEGEESVVISNADGADSTDLPPQVDPDDIEAPQTWYYSILDAVFLVR